MKRGVARSGKPTLRTIAELTGLATTTISRALNNAPELAAETRLRVQKVAAEIGYVPDRTALRLKTGRTHVVSLILDPHWEILNFSQSIIAGVTEAFRDTPYHLVITPSFLGSSSLDPVNYVLRNRTADGVIFSRTEPNDARVRLLLDQDFPFVSHGRTEIGRAHPYVDYDNFAFAYQAVMRLKAKGRKRISMIALPSERFTFTKHLRDGMLRATADAGLSCEFDTRVQFDDRIADIRRVTMTRMGESDPPDGFVCPGDAVALAVVAGIADAGLVIGRDVDVVTKQMSGIFSLVRPRVDAIDEDIMLTGRQLAELLLRRIQGEPAEALQILQVPRAGF